MDQLEKVLALVDSNHEGEALGALRMARRLLAKHGMSFRDLARMTAKPGFSMRGGFFSGAQVQLEAKVEQLQDDLEAHAQQNASLTAQIDFWRRRSFELEQMLNLNQAEAAKWKAVARETAERLWDLGQAACAQTALSETVEACVEETCEAEAVEDEAAEAEALKAAG